MCFEVDYSYIKTTLNSLDKYSGGETIPKYCCLLTYQQIPIIGVAREYQERLNCMLYTIFCIYIILITLIINLN